MAEEEFILDLSPTEYTVIPDLGSALRLDAKNPSAVFFLQAATLRQGKCLTVDVPGFRIVTEQPKIASCPFVIRLKGAEDFVCLCFKGNGANLYCYGLSVEDLMKWKFCRLLGAIPKAELSELCPKWHKNGTQR